VASGQKRNEMLAGGFGRLKFPLGPSLKSALIAKLRLGVRFCVATGPHHAHINLPTPLFVLCILPAV